jgi:hypothetical protein
MKLIRRITHMAKRYYQVMRPNTIRLRDKDGQYGVFFGANPIATIDCNQIA